jgi:molybdate transport system substrate-binding protein
LGIALVLWREAQDEISAPKVSATGSGGESVDLVAAGEAELALGNTPVFVAKPGVELVGPIPTELYDTKDFAFKVGIGANAKESGAAKVLIEYLLSPGASRVWKARGVEPGPG